MTATRSDIDGWFDQGVAKGATFMVVVCDTFDFDDYPCYFDNAESTLKKCAAVHLDAFQRVLEVYDLSMDKEEQLNERRAYHLP